MFIKNRYAPIETWYVKNGKAFQPGLRYWVGGATKRYGWAAFVALGLGAFVVFRRGAKSVEDSQAVAP